MRRSAMCSCVPGSLGLSLMPMLPKGAASEVLMASESQVRVFTLCPLAL